MIKLFKLLQRKYTNQVNLDDNGIIKFRTLKDLKPRTFLLKQESDNKFYIYNDKNNPIFRSSEIGEILNKIREIENNNKINEIASEERVEVKSIEFYQQVLNQSRLNPKTRTLVQGVINNIKAKNNLATQKQLLILQKLRDGVLFEMKAKPGFNINALISNPKFLEQFIGDLNWFRNNGRAYPEGVMDNLAKLYSKKTDTTPALTYDQIEEILEYLTNNKLINIF